MSNKSENQKLSTVDKSAPAATALPYGLVLDAGDLAVAGGACRV